MATTTTTTTAITVDVVRDNGRQMLSQPQPSCLYIAAAAAFLLSMHRGSQRLPVRPPPPVANRSILRCNNPAGASPEDRSHILSGHLDIKPKHKAKLIARVTTIILPRHRPPARRPQGMARNKEGGEVGRETGGAELLPVPSASVFFSSERNVENR